MAKDGKGLLPELERVGSLRSAMADALAALERGPFHGLVCLPAPSLRRLVESGQEEQARLEVGVERGPAALKEAPVQQQDARMRGSVTDDMAEGGVRASGGRAMAELQARSEGLDGPMPAAPGVRGPVVGAIAPSDRYHGALRVLAALVEERGMSCQSAPNDDALVTRAVRMVQQVEGLALGLGRDVREL